MTEPIADLTLKNAVVICPGGLATAGSVAVRSGRIDRVTFEPAPPPPARVTRDVGRKLLIPGLIDAHVHFRTPGYEGKETWADGSRAAVAGGVTTVIDMPNVDPHYADTAGLLARVASAQGQSLVDFAFHLGVTPESIPALERADPTLVPSCKVFLAAHHTARHVIREDRDLDRIFEVAARRGFLLTLHAEDADTLDLLASDRGQPHSLHEYEKTYGRAAAIISVGRVLDRVRRYGTRAHVLHVSSEEEIDLLEAAARTGLPVSFEALAHHLTFTAEDEHLGTLGKLRPALRTPRDRDRLWRAVIAGSVRTLGSDHAPHTRAEKEVPFADAPPGFPGVQELAPAFLTGLRRFAPDSGADARLALLVRLAAEAPARLFGLDHRKGRLEAGYDADLVVVDPDRHFRMTVSDTFTHCKWSAYSEIEFQGMPVLTVRGGRVVYDAEAASGHRFGEPNGAFLPVRRVRTGH